jgi:alpha-amylase/alpha-mannosidase (GH57 family)
VKRCASIHGHFYQPPRENPWTNSVERQPSAGRDHDWNARVARECYVPNGEARVLDGSGRISDVVDNYEWMSFNFGPTLLAWLEAAHPAAYARLLQADKKSAERLGGHGNGVAQSYHHTILPLSHPRDRVTEVRWGLADFSHRFSRKPEGMWLPECAADDATLAVLAAEGVKFVILESGQAESVRDAAGEWLAASAHLVPGVPYLWRGPAGVDLAIFFYDGELSRAVAFERAMSDSRAFARRIAAKLLPTAEDELVLLATDGESYGHHSPFGEMGLAHLLRYALPEVNVTLVNPGWFLARNPAAVEVKLKAGGTSWSCAHGVERWRSDCGCGAEGGRHQKWRAPLRAALESLREKLADLYERKSAGLLADCWAARDAYISVVLDRSDASFDRFLAAHAPGAVDEESKVRALRLLEMQRHALMMFTSCGWFFEELSRLEPVQVLLYAARALELARSFGADFEPEFVEGLRLAPSNEALFRNGAGIWETLVRPHVHTQDHVAAHYAVSLLFEDKPPTKVQGRSVKCERFTRRAENGATVAAGRAEFVEATTRERWTRSFFSAVLPGQRVHAYVCNDELGEGSFDLLMSDATQGTQSCPLPQGRHFLLRDLRPDEREKVLSLVLRRRLSRWESAAVESLEETLPLVEQFRGLGLPLPAGLGEETRLVYSHVLASLAERFGRGEPGAQAELRSMFERGASAELELYRPLLEGPWERGISRLLAVLERGLEEKPLKDLREAAQFAERAGLSAYRPSAQIRFFRILKSLPAPDALARETALALGVAA